MPALLFTMKNLNYCKPKLIPIEEPDKLGSEVIQKVLNKLESLDIKCDCGYSVFITSTLDNPFFCPNCFDDLPGPYEEEPVYGNTNNCPDWIERIEPGRKPKCGWYGHLFDSGAICDERWCPRIKYSLGF